MSSMINSLSPERETMLNDLSAAKAVLENPGAVEKTAYAALEMLGMNTGK